MGTVKIWNLPQFQILKKLRQKLSTTSQVLRRLRVVKIVLHQKPMLKAIFVFCVERRAVRGKTLKYISTGNIKNTQSQTSSWRAASPLMRSLPNLSLVGTLRARSLTQTKYLYERTKSKIMGQPKCLAGDGENLWMMLIPLELLLLILTPPPFQWMTWMTCLRKVGGEQRNLRGSRQNIMETQKKRFLLVRTILQRMRMLMSRSRSLRRR